MPTHSLQPWENCPLPTHILLASQSPRRLALLQTLGIQTTAIAPSHSHAEALETPLANEDPLLYVQRIANLKLHAALATVATAGELPYQTKWILAADTTVAQNGQLLGKPATPQEAQTMLESLSNTWHTVHTAVAVAHLGKPANAHRIDHQFKTTGQTHHSATVHMAQLPLQFIKAYIASGEPFDKAGGYGIQGCMAQYVRHIEGSHSGIVGLPLFETACLLKQMQYTLENKNHPNHE